MFELTGKKALVTGSSRGIGRGIALALAKQGADVVVNYVSSEDKAQAVVREIQEMGRESFAVKADVSKRPEVGLMFKKVKEKWGKLDILVNNAGVISYADFENITDEQWNSVIDTNLKGQFMCSQEAVKLMKEKGWGRIINIASIASGGVGVGFSKIAHYTSSKGGVIGLTENMAMELGKSGINVNVIAPGGIETDMVKAIKDDPEALKAMLAKVPKGRLGKPEDIGAAAAFLASDEADYITGSTLYVDGGWLAD